MYDWIKSDGLETVKGSTLISITPNGLADAVINDQFVLPYDTMMDFSEFLKCLKDSNSPVYYLQSQNDNLRKDETLLPFFERIPKEIDFVSSSLGRSPDAVNLWIGNHSSTTTLHRDQYENIYHVVFGTKVFTLYIYNILILEYHQQTVFT